MSAGVWSLTNTCLKLYYSLRFPDPRVDEDSPGHAQRSQETGVYGDE
jgi:hypothetical protein